MYKKYSSKSVVGTMLLTTFCLMGSNAYAGEPGACEASISQFEDIVATDSLVYSALTTAREGVQALPENYGGFSGVNPWQIEGSNESFMKHFRQVFEEWCEFLPEANGSHDNGLYYIQYFGMFYYNNPAAVDFVQGRNPNYRSQHPRDPNQLSALYDFVQSFSEQHQN